jgi:hypothetical protein
MSCNTKVNRLPRFKRLYPNVYSYRAELLYGKRFQQKLRTSKTFNQVKSTFEEVNPDYFNRQDSIIITYGTRAGGTQKLRTRKAGVI